MCDGAPALSGRLAALKRSRFGLLLVFCLLPFGAQAELAGLPAHARLVAEEVEPLAEPALAAGPWKDGALPAITARGAVTRQAWQIAGSDLTTAQILDPLQRSLEDKGFEPVFNCSDRACGGFEFRYGIDVLPEPDMHVDLGDYRYLLMAHAAGARKDYVALLVSRAGRRGFVHVTQVGAALPVPAVAENAVEQAAPPPDRAAGAARDLPAPPATGKAAPGTLVQTLSETGRAVLSDLRFEPGSSQLAGADFASLGVLADWMKRNPGKRVVLVGHSDNDGSLTSNMNLSRKRAQTVRDKLRTDYGIAGERLAAEGVGYLAPLVSNASEAGRMRNRRVEAVLAEDG